MNYKKLTKCHLKFGMHFDKIGMIGIIRLRH